MSAKVPAKEVQINEQIVSKLLKEQFPELAHLPITFLAAGWDNENYRLGNEYLVRLLTALHQYKPSHAPINPYRSIPLQEKEENINTRMLRLEEKSPLISKVIRAAWRRALNAPVSEPKCLIHGDLHPRNIIVQEGKVKAIIN